MRSAKDRSYINLSHILDISCTSSLERYLYKLRMLPLIRLWKRFNLAWPPRNAISSTKLVDFVS
ncbi:hypothetical protein CR513_12174, partial [Mucuna pruriens]